MAGPTAHLTSWCETTRGEVPLPLTGPSLTISPLPPPYPQTIFLFGGKHVHSRRLTNDIWAMDLVTKVWEKLDAGEGPCPRYFHSMDTWDDKLVCFGGMSESDPLCVHNDIWFFDCRMRKWIPQPDPSQGIGLGITSDITQDPALVPQPRYAHLSAVSRGQLVIFGGQHSDNSWIYEVNVYDLTHKVWVSRTQQPELNGLHSKGAYRSVATSSKQRVIFPKGGTPSYAIPEEGEGGDIWCFSNYDFAKVRREIEVINPIDPMSPPQTVSRKFRSPPDFNIRDETDRMHGSSQPPGLRFPTGGIVGNHFILCGLYLASSSAAFSIWALDLSTLAWKHLEPSVLSTGSWNRAVIWPERAKLVVFGNNQYDLASDYGRRAVNLDHVAIINLETYGIYRPPRLEVPTKVQEMGLSMLEDKLASEFEVVCEDGRKVKCSRKILSERWPWFAQQERALEAKTAGVLREAPALDINDTLLGSFTPARLTPTCLNIPEPFPVCVALVQYFYTLSLSTPLQNRAPVLSALLFLAKQYKIDRLRDLVVHALHGRLEPSIASGIYEIATLSGEQELQVRALNMLHSARGQSSSRGHQRRPSASQPNDGPPSSAPPPTPGSAAGQGGASSGEPPIPARNGSTGLGQYRQVRESTMLPDDVEERDRNQINDLLAALSVLTKEVDLGPRPESPLDPNAPTEPMIPPSPPKTVRSVINAPVDRQIMRRPSSPSSSDPPSYPVTPRGSMRDYLGEMASPSSLMDSHSITSSSFSKPLLATLPETEPVDPKSITRTFTSRMDPSAAIDLSRTDGFRKPLLPSSASVMSDGSSNSITLGMNPIIMTPTSASSSMRPNDTDLWRQTVDNASISSGSSGPSRSTLGGPPLTKAEKKLLEAEEKARKKADAQAQFEARRREQIRKIAMDRAEAQKLADMTAVVTAPPKPAPPKGRFGKFAFKFAESVLLPTGGEGSNTMF